MPRKSTALLLVALAAVAVVLVGLVFSGAFSAIIEPRYPQQPDPEHIPEDKATSWSQITDDPIETTQEWSLTAEGRLLSVHYTQNDTVTVVYRNKSVRLDSSDGSVLNRTRFGGVVVNTEKYFPAPPSGRVSNAAYGYNIADTPVLIRDNGTYYRFNVSSWSRTRLADLNVRNPITEWVKKDKLLVKRNDSTAAFVNFSTGETTEYGEVPADIFAVDNNGTLIYTRNRTYARFPNGSETLVFLNGTKYQGNVEPSKRGVEHTIAANEYMVVVTYPDVGFGHTYIYNRDTGETEWDRAFVDYLRLSGRTAKIRRIVVPPQADSRYRFYRYHLNGSYTSDVFRPLAPRGTGIAGEYSYISRGEIGDTNSSYVGLYRNGTMRFLRVNGSVGTVHELSVSPNRRSVVASNGSAVFELSLNRTLG